MNYIEEIYTQTLQSLDNKGRLRQIPNIYQQGRYIIDEKGRKYLNLSGNDYLGIGARGDYHEELAKRYEEEKIILGSCSSRLLTGNNIYFERLENKMGEAFGHRSCLLFNSGYHMNTGILPALATDKSVILADKLIHASIIDGLRLSRCSYERFRHNDLNHLEKLIKKHSNSPDIIVVVESIYSMDGDQADLLYLVQLKKQYPQIRLYVDEAHAIGIRGNNGYGLAEELHIISDIDILVGTFGKALAGMGGYIICDKITKNILIQNCRSLIFSTALPPINIAYNELIFDHLPTYTKERLRLWDISLTTKKRLEETGYFNNSSSHIVPILLGEDTKAIELSKRLRDVGLFVLPIRPPSVPENQSRIRLSLTAETYDFDILYEVLQQLK